MVYLNLKKFTMNKKLKISIFLAGIYVCFLLYSRYRGQESAINDFNQLTCSFVSKGSLQPIPRTESGKWKSSEDRINFALKLCDISTSNINEVEKYDNILGYISGIYLYYNRKSDLLQTLYQKYAFQEVIDPQVMNNHKQ